MVVLSCFALGQSSLPLQIAYLCSAILSCCFLLAYFKKGSLSINFQLSLMILFISFAFVLYCITKYSCCYSLVSLCFCCRSKSCIDNPGFITRFLKKKKKNMSSCLLPCLQAQTVCSMQCVLSVCLRKIVVWMCPSSLFFIMDETVVGLVLCR